MSTGQIHDLGYKRYVGSRRAVGTRWRVIMRHQIATAWTGWWRFKMWMIAAVLTTTSIGAVLYFLHDRVFKVLGGAGGQIVRFADGLVPMSARFYGWIGFIVSLTVSATLVAGDLRSGAFTFYFARSVRPLDYVLGKLAGLAVLFAVIMAAGPLVLAGVRLGLSEDLDEVIALLPMLGKELIIGAVGTVVFAVVPLGFSALSGSRRQALALWAAYYIVIGAMAHGLSFAISPIIGAIDVGRCLEEIALRLYDQRWGGRGPDIPLTAALISIGVHAVAAIAVVIWRVRRAQQTGVGGGS